MPDMGNEAPDFCPECGGKRVLGMTCWEQLGALLAWEWDDPELYAEHFLTVAAYNLQHPAQFTDEAVERLRAIFIRHVDEQVPASVLRQAVARDFAGSKRVLKERAESKTCGQRWRMTIADVYLPDRPQGAAERVPRWAGSIRYELALA